MEKKIKEIEDDTESIWSSIYDVILVFTSLFAFVACIITGELILSVGGFVILTYSKTREIERKISKIEKKICGEEDVQ